MDHYSRRIMGITAFKTEPSGVAVRALGRTIAASGAIPKHLICDKGPQFWPCKDFKDWCDGKDIKPRFGKVGEHGSIALVERFILTMKLVLAQLPLIPLRRESFRKELTVIIQWYNEHWPRSSPCARPQTLVAGKPGQRFEMTVNFYRRRRHLPVVTLERAA